MEGHFLCSLAKMQKVPVVSFKVVTDNADSDTWLSVKGNSERWSKILGNVVLSFVKYYLDCHALDELGSQ
jgi:hypothetical protein